MVRLLKIQVCWFVKHLNEGKRLRLDQVTKSEVVEVSEWADSSAALPLTSIVKNNILKVQ